MNYINIQAHRGASAYAPENTMAAFKMAVEMKADCIELDVQLTSDGEIVVIHDEKVNRTSNGYGLVKDMSYKELKALDFGSWFNPEYANERIPLLEEVMELVKCSDILLNIELKASVASDGIESKVASMINKFSMKDKVIVSSFNHYSLVEIKRLDAEIKTGILYSEVLYNPWEYAKRLNAAAIHPYYKSLLPATAQNCINNSILVNTWTVDSPEDILRLAGNGVTGIITNKPDLAIKLIRG